MKFGIANIVLFCFLLCVSSFKAQNTDEEQGVLKRYFNQILNDTNDLSAPKFMTYPTLAYSPETRWEIGLSSLYIYSAKRDLENRLSEVKAFTFYTLEKQYGIWLDHMLYTDKNEWFFSEGLDIKVSLYYILVLAQIVSQNIFQELMENTRSSENAF